MNREAVQRTFIVGSEWIYYKVYCGINTADSLLVEGIASMAAQLIKKGIIDKWFFIRYADPDKHLRIRFHLEDINKIGDVIRNIHTVLEPYHKDNLVWNVQLDTYNRELERYGANTIEDLESYFCYDSEAVLKIIKESVTEEIRFDKTFEFVDSIINCFIESTEEKLTFLDRMQLSYKNEFHINNSRKKLLSKKYRTFKNVIQTTNSDENSIDLDSFKSIVAKIKVLEGRGELKLPLENLLSSIVHMTVNRVFQSRQRLYEMVLYDFLHQKCRSDYYIQKSQKKKQ